MRCFIFSETEERMQSLHGSFASLKMTKLFGLGQSRFGCKKAGGKHGSCLPLTSAAEAASSSVLRRHD